MTTITCPKCSGAGHLEVDDSGVSCEATITVGIETIGCFASRKHPGRPHLAILCDPCSACGQFDEHDESCLIYLAGPEPFVPSGWWQWNDGDLALGRAPEGAGQTWRNEFQPDSPWAKAPA